MSRSFTLEELKRYNGIQGNPIYVAVKGTVFDVSVAAGFYGPGGSYHVFSGHESSVLLAKSALDPSLLNQDHRTLSDESEIQCLNQWYQKFESKYTKVGTVAGFHSAL